MTTGGSPFSVKRSGTGIAVSPQGSASITLGNGIDKCWAAIICGLPVGIIAGLLDGLFQRLIEAIGFDRYSVVVVGCVAATDGIVSHCAVSTVAVIGCGFGANGSDIER